MWGLVLGWMWCFVCLIYCLLKVLRALETARLTWMCPCWPLHQCDFLNVVFWCSLSDSKMELFVYLVVWWRNCSMSLVDVLWVDFQQTSLYVLYSNWKQGLIVYLLNPTFSMSRYQVDSSPSLWWETCSYNSSTDRQPSAPRSSRPHCRHGLFSFFPWEFSQAQWYWYSAALALHITAGSCFPFQEFQVLGSLPGFGR